MDRRAVILGASASLLAGPGFAARLTGAEWRVLGWETPRRGQDRRLAFELPAQTRLRRLRLMLAGQGAAIERLRLHSGESVVLALDWALSAADPVAFRELLLDPRRVLTRIEVTMARLPMEGAAMRLFGRFG